MEKGETMNKSTCIRDNCGMPYDMDAIEERPRSTLKAFWQRYCPKHRESTSPAIVAVEATPFWGDEETERTGRIY